jgi:hypothetical protein
LLLILIQVDVRALVDGLPILAPPPLRQPNADLDRLNRFRTEAHLADSGSKASSHLTTALDIRLGHGDCEFVSTDAGTKVRCAYDSLQLLTHEPQGVVATAMTLAVVDPLEVVEVDHHHRQAPLVALGERDLALHEALELSTVGKPCQMIRTRLG